MNLLPNCEDLEQAAQIVYANMAPTPQYSWPLLCEQLGFETWLKHENHTPSGAFKIRGGLVYFSKLIKREPDIKGVISATRGNHGQSVAYAARKYGIAATIVVPHGNSLEKNSAMRALGVELIEHGEDFQAAREHARQLADERGLHMIPAFHRDLLLGVASYCMEFLRGVPDLDVVYVPIGQGSGICSMIAARDALRHTAEIVGVVSSHAPAYALSFAATEKIEAPVTTQLADGMACRVPDEAALNIIIQGANRIVQVSDSDVAAAMKLLFITTHNVVEGAGAAPLAAAFAEREQLRGRKVGLIASGGNVDHDVFANVLGNANDR